MISPLLYERDPCLLERWHEKVPYEEFDYWNQSALLYFDAAGSDESKKLEDRVC